MIFGALIQLCSHFSVFCVEIQTQFHVFVQTMRSNNVNEYLSELFQSFMLQHRILHQISCVDTLSHNEVVKREIDIFLRLPEPFCSK